MGLEAPIRALAGAASNSNQKWKQKGCVREIWEFP